MSMMYPAETNNLYERFREENPPISYTEWLELLINDLEDKNKCKVVSKTLSLRNCMDTLVLLEQAIYSNIEILTEVHCAFEILNSVSIKSTVGFLKKYAEEKLNTIDDIAKNTKFNGMPLCDGTYEDRGIEVYIDSTEKIEIKLKGVSLNHLHLTDFSNKADFEHAEATIKSNIKQLYQYIGIIENRMNS